MKKLISLVFLLSLSAFTYSQTWFPLGAKWYFNIIEEDIYSNTVGWGFSEYEVIKDTLIDSKTAKIVSKKVITYDNEVFHYDNTILMEEGGMVYFFQNNVFYLMYDFNLEIGDTLPIVNFFDCDSSKQLVLDSLTNLTIGGNTLKVQHFSGKAYKGGKEEKFNLEIIEKIGYKRIQQSITFQPKYYCSFEYVFSQIGTPLRCYIDNDLHYKNEWFSYENCDSLIDFTVGIAEKNISSFKVLPNPTRGIIEIDVNSNDQFLELTSLQGQTISQQNLLANNSENKITLDLTSYPSGVYFLSITTKSGEKKSAKIVKQ